MAEEQDKTHRLLFHFPRMVEDLVRYCLGGAWVARLDFSTLDKVPERLLSPELKRREQDILWRVAIRQNPHEIREIDPRSAPKEPSDWFYVYLHLEHQSRPRKLMALDMVTYKLLALHDLARRKALAPGGKLPTILSVVFYNHDKPWTAATSLLDLLEPLPDGPEGLDFWSYHLIDAQRHDLSPLIGSKSPLLGLFRLEQLENMQGLSEAVDDLRVVLNLADQELADAFVTFINQAVLPRLTSEGDNIPTIRDLQEVPTMIGQRIERIKEEIANQARSEGLRSGRQEGLKQGLQEGRQEGRQEGLKQGLQEGRQEGRQEGLKQGLQEGRQEGRQEGLKQGLQEGRQTLLKDLIEHKFGRVDPELENRLEQASMEDLLRWSRRMLTATTLEEILSDSDSSDGWIA